MHLGCRVMPAAPHELPSWTTGCPTRKRQDDEPRPAHDTMNPDPPPKGNEPVDISALTGRRGHRGAVRSAAAPIERRSTTPPDPVDARRLVGLAGLPTIVAVGPFDDHAHARQLADAFVTVRKRCNSQLVLLGAGAQRSFVTRHTSARGVGSSVHVVRGLRRGRWSDLVAAADLVVLGDSSEIETLIDVLALGRPVVAPADPAAVHLLVPAVVGLVYPPGDVSVMAAALLRLLSDPALRRAMGGRARNVARRHRLECDTRTHSYEADSLL